MSRRVELLTRAQRDITRLDRQVAARVYDELERFALDGHGDVKPLRGVTPAEWRLRVGDWRVRFRYDGDNETGSIQVLRVEHRSAVYRD